MTIVPLLTFPSPDPAYVDLPCHVMDVESQECVYCGNSPIWGTYAEYVDHFWSREWEGDPWHVPSDEAMFDWLAATCLTAPE